MNIKGAYMESKFWVGSWAMVLAVAFHMLPVKTHGAVVTLVPTDAVWSYLDNGSDQGSTWRDPLFDDSGWASGPAQLGYGDGDEATVVGFGPDSGNKYVTTYFRHQFQVTDASSYNSLTLRLMRDDGAVVYLNGTEVFRSNMPGGAISSTTTASGAVGGADESSFFSVNPDPALLVEGSNLLAVEIHQANATSSDISFALELEAVRETIQIILNNPLDGAANVSEQPTLDVSVTHLDSLSMNVTFSGRVVPPVGDDFTLIALPDTQYYVSSLNGGLPEMFVAQTDWIVDNILTRNIVFTTQLGDCVQNGDSFEIEWQHATNALYRLENPMTTMLDEGLPYGVAVGNHDQSPSGDTDGSTFYYNLYFGIDHFNGRSYYAGHYGTNNDNHVEFFTAGGLDFMVVHLEYDTSPDQAVLDWANALLQSNPDRQTVVVTHYLIGTGNPGAFGTQGQAIYDALKGNPNLFLMLSGHVPGEGRRTDTFNGNTVHTLLADYQGRSGGGSGWLRILEFSPLDSVIRVQTYSPWLDQVEIDADSDFEIYYDMQSLVGDPFGLIADNLNVPSGSSTTALWDNLAPGTEYEWFVTVSDGTETVTSPAWRFTTAAGPPAAPTALVATGGDGQVTLSWDVSPGATSYTAKRSTTAGVPYEDTLASGLTAPGFVDTTVVNGTTYYYVVSASNGAGTSPDSNEASATPQFNNPPVAGSDSYPVDEDQSLVISSPGVLSNDTDDEGDPLAAVLINDVSNGVLSLNSDGSFTYTPNANFFGIDSFDYQATDGGKFSNLATVTLTVKSVNDSPSAIDDSAITLRDVAVTIDVLANDSDVEGDPLVVLGATSGANGTTLVNPDYTIRYVPNSGFEGQDSFTYTISDGVATAQATVTVDVQKLVIFSDGFESGDFIAGGWIIASGPSSVDVSAAVNGNFGALLKKNASISKELLNLTATTVEISYWRKTDKLAGNESLLVEWSADGQQWFPLETVAGTEDWQFKAWELDLASPSLYLRFALNGNAGNDAAMIDDVEVAIVADVTFPTASNDAYDVVEDGLLAVAAPGVLGNDSDPEGDFLMADLVSGTSQGTLGLNADGSFSYTPNQDFHGTDSFTYAANDGTTTSSPATVLITVSAVNDDPVTNDDTYSTDEDNALVISAPGVLSNDGDVDGDALTVSLNTDVTQGALTLNADGSFSYTPSADFSGTDTFSYVADDGNGGQAVGTVNLTINALNDAPVAADDAYLVDEDGVLTVSVAGVLDNDTDIDDDPLTAVLLQDVSNGALALNADGSFQYTPQPDFFGADSFTYAADDGSAQSALATVTITVNAVNDLPLALDDAYSLDENTSLSISAPGVLGNDTDADGDALSASLETVPSHGAVTLSADGSFLYTPDTDYVGPDSFTYLASDGKGGSDSATVNLTINEFNATPVANDDAYEVDEDTLLTISVPGVLGNDTDLENDPLTANLVLDTANGSLTLNAVGSFSYLPDADFHGADVFTYVAGDGNSQSPVATVVITVNPINDAPVAMDDAYSLDENTTLTVTGPGVLTNDSDVDGDPITALLQSDVSNGTLALNSNGSFTYTPSVDFIGSDSFTYAADDGNGGITLATVILTINEVNETPIANDDAGYVVDEDSVLNVATPGVLGNDTDSEANPLTAILVSGPANGGLTLNGDGSFEYTPDLNFHGIDTFTYAASDGNTQSDPATVTITVNPVNDLPVASGDAYGVAEDTLLTVPAPGVLGNDTDPDGDPLIVLLITDVSQGVLVLNADGSFDYTPNLNYSGPDGFTYQVDDGQGGLASATVSLTVSPVNDAPVTADDAYPIDEDGVLTVAATSILDNDADVDGDTLSAVLVDDVANGVLVLNADGTFDYTPNADFNGVDSFTYVADDGFAQSSLGTVVITVNSVNDSPVTANDSYSLSQDTALVVNAPGVLSNDSDVENDPLTASLDSGPSNGVLTLNGDGSFTYTPNQGFAGADSFTYFASDGQGGTSVATVSLAVIAPPIGLHVADLDGTSINDGPTWTAVVTITIHDGNHGALADATVTGTWDGGASTVSGTTDASGQVTFSLGGTPKREGQVTFAIVDVTHATLAYDLPSNHDPDGDSDGSTIVVLKP